MKNILRISLILIIISSCTKEQEYPIIPEIKFDSFSLYSKIRDIGDTVLAGELKFTITDGDGNIGYEVGDSFPGFDTSKVYLNMYEKVNDEYIIVQADDSTNFQIPYITPAGKSKSLKAEILLEFEYFLEPSMYDTIKYDFYVIDRAYNMSNIESTPDIIFY